MIGVGVDLYGHPMNFGEFVLSILLVAALFAFSLWAMTEKAWATAAALSGFFAICGAIGVIWTALAWLGHVLF